MPVPLDEQRQDELTAYLDGELDPQSAAAMDRQLRDDANLRQEAQALRRTWELLDFLPQPEPSPAFASKTLDKLEIVVPAHGKTAPPVPSTLLPVVPPRRPWPARLALAGAAAAVFLIGYGLTGPFLKKGPSALSREEREEQMARDLRVIDHLPQYQYVDDLDFLAGLDQPDLFGE